MTGEPTDRTDRIWTLPNIITIGRILLTPAFIMAFLAGRPGLALGLFALAGASDALDGILAKRLNQRSRLGAMLDPLADKALLVSAYLCLAMQSMVPMWLAVLVVSRDVIIIGGAGVLHVCGVDVGRAIQPIIVSKVNTACQILLVVAALGLAAADTAAPGLMTAGAWLVGVLTTISLVRYVIIGLELLARRPA